MSEERSQHENRERTIFPIERGFPIERVNEIAEKEGRAKQWYRPIYTMHKWWARRLGCVFRSIALYTLLSESADIEVHEPGKNGNLSDFGSGGKEIQKLIDEVDMADPDSLWSLYSKDVRVNNKKILDPFSGGGTSLVETSRFGVESVGYDLNPVAWFITKKELDAGQTDVDDLDKVFNELEENVAEDILDYYKTPCPNGDHEANVIYNFWVKELDCVSCNHTVPLFRDFRIAKGRFENDDKYNILCPDCNSIFLASDWRERCTCTFCNHEFVPEDGNVGRGNYSCPDCGQKYGVTDGIKEQNGYGSRLYAVEYYCEECDNLGKSKGEVKGYKAAEEADHETFKKACEEWHNSANLKKYAPDSNIPRGAVTIVEPGVNYDGHDLFDHSIEKWTDMYNERQLLCLSKILHEIDNIESQNLKEFLLLTLTESLNYNSLMSVYNPSYNKNTNIFKSNSFDPPTEPIENNVWGTKFGTGTFTAMWDMVRRGVEYANAPTERYIDDGESLETPAFSKSIGENASVYQGDMRKLDAEDEFDAVITDPPYYDNIIYSELSDFFYVWQKPILDKKYGAFETEKTPRSESIVTNPYLDKTVEDFEHDLGEAFRVIKRSLKQDGILAFTYHHSDSESWGELLTSLCESGFEVTATYPISADMNKFTKGEAVEFDIIIVARPSREREPISWNSLRRDIYRTAQKTRNRLEENRDLSRGDIGVVEMGRCFHEYSKHHGKVERAGETMTAKEVVDEIYGVIQHGSDIGEIDVFLDLLETPGASYDDLNKLCRGTNATPERMEDMRLYRMDDGFQLGTWDDEKRMDYIQRRVDSDEELTDLDKAQFLRYRWEHGKSVTEYLNDWEITDDLRELCEGLGDATGDDTYRNILESRLSDF